MILLKNLKVKLEAKKKLAEKCQRLVDRLPGRAKKGGGRSPGSLRKRNAISKVKKYTQEIQELKIKIEEIS